MPEISLEFTEPIKCFSRSGVKRQERGPYCRLVSSAGENRNFTVGNDLFMCKRADMLPIQGDSKRKFNIFGGDSIGNNEKRRSYDCVSNSEWLSRQSCSNLQT